MIRWLACALVLLGLPSRAAPPEVTVQIFGIFKPTSARISAAGGRAMTLTAIAEDGRRRRIRARRVDVRCGGRSPLAVKVGERLIPAASLQVHPAPGSDRLLVSVPGTERARPYTGSFELRERAGRCEIVNRVGLEDYVRSTACREMGPAAAEALKAQAILVRTWALGHRGRHAGADFCDLTHCQVYEGIAACDPAATPILESVRGKVLLAGEGLADVAYASTCGGHTARAADIWGPASARSYLAGVPDGQPALCSRSPHFRWRFETKLASACAAVRAARPALGPGPCRFEVTQRGAGGWVRRVRVTAGGELELTGEQFHMLMGRAFGWGRFKSAHFKIQATAGRIAFVGRGLGHGVGLCQYGAMAMAERGADHEAILAHYFPGTRIGAAP